MYDVESPIGPKYGPICIEGVELIPPSLPGSIAWTFQVTSDIFAMEWNSVLPGLHVRYPEIDAPLHSTKDVKPREV